MKKRIVSLLLVVLLLTVSAVPALATAPKVKKVEYDGNGVVDVDFTTKNVRYKNAKVVVKDSSGKKLTARIIEKDNDEVSFKATGVKAGKKYTFTISGVRAGKSGSGRKRTRSGRKSARLLVRDIYAMLGSTCQVSFLNRTPGRGTTRRHLKCVKTPNSPRR